jgi:hypothetical protein
MYSSKAALHAEHSRIRRQQVCSCSRVISNPNCQHDGSPGYYERTMLHSHHRLVFQAGVLRAPSEAAISGAAASSKHCEYKTRANRASRLRCRAPIPCIEQYTPPSCPLSCTRIFAPAHARPTQQRGGCPAPQLLGTRVWCLA